MTPPKGIPLLLALFGVFLAVMIFVSPAKPVASTAVQKDESGKTVPSALHITEVMSSNKTTLPDESGKFPDWVELTNEGTTPLPLSGYGLSDRDDKIIFTFPSGEQLAPGGRIIVFASNESRSVSGATYHANFKISSSGETLVLFGPHGDAIEQVQVPAMTGDLVYAKTGDSWIISDMPTPGYENTQEGRAAFLSASQLADSELVINEIVASNKTTLADEDGEYSDWIELYNRGKRAIDLSKFALSDNPEKMVKWRFPDGASIAPGGYYVVFASGKDRTGGPNLRPHTNFRLSAEAATVLLCDVQGRLVDQTKYEVMPADESWGRKDTGDLSWQFFRTPTPEMPNNNESSLEMDRRILAANTSGIAISEVMASNTATTLPIEAKVDWIELFNFGQDAVDLNGYGLSDSISHPRKWRFPSVVLSPGQRLLVYCDKTNTNGKSGDIHTNFAVSSAGETLAFCDPSGHILDKLVVPQLLPDLSYGRTQGQDGLFYYSAPTPGEANGTGFLGFAEEPTFATRGGVYRNSLKIKLNVPEGTEVRYTTDATLPTESSELYTGAFEVSTTTVIRARSFQAGLSPSQPITQTFFVSVFHSVPIISLVTEPDNITNPDTGMLADGPELNRETQEPAWTNATYWKKLHYDGHVEMYFQDESENGQQALSTGMNFHVMGQFSLDMPQKSFSVNAKKRFGTGYFEYPLFDDRPFQRYKSFALRNGGQDGKFTRVIDGLQGKIAMEGSDGDLIAQAWRPVVVYLNGEYWGAYDLRERVSRYFVAQHNGWEDPDAMSILESDGVKSRQVKWGSHREYSKLQDYLQNHDLTDPEAMQYIEDRVDIDSLFDYYIFETYIGNSDTGNVRFYKKDGEGNKWRWIFYDGDWGFFDAERYGPSFFLKEAGAGSKNINNLLIRKVLENPTMKDRYLTRCGQWFQTVLKPDAVLEKFDAMITQITPEMTMNFNRWAEEMHPKVSFDVPKNPEGALKYWEGRVARARRIIRKRPNYYWSMTKEFFGLNDEQMIHYLGPQPEIPEDLLPTPAPTKKAK